MRVIIEQPVFAHADGHALELPAIVELCREERHALLTDPLFRREGTAPVNLWLRGLSEPQQRSIRIVFEQGAEVAAQRHRHSPTIRITHGQPSHWQGLTPRLTVKDGLRLIREPLKLLVENGRNERAFLFWLATNEYRKALKVAEDKGWIRFEHGGGINPDFSPLRLLRP